MHLVMRHVQIRSDDVKSENPNRGQSGLLVWLLEPYKLLWGFQKRRIYLLLFIVQEFKEKKIICYRFIYN